MSKPTIRAILLDLDDTLYSTSKFTQIARYNAMKAMHEAGVQLSPKQLLEELDEVILEFSSNYSHHFEKLLRRIPQETYAKVNPSILVAAAVIAYHNTKQTDLHPYPDGITFLEKISKKNILVGVITAGLAIKQAEKLLRLGIYSYLNPNAIFISEAIGISKPNPKLYLHACSALKLSPEEVMYVGDNPANDIDPTNKIGMISVRMRRGGKYSNRESKTPPLYEVKNYDELWTILENDFDIN